MLVLGRDEKAKYPFLADAGRHLQEQGFELSQFGTDPVLRVVVDKALERLMAATRGSVYESGLMGGRASQDRTLDIEIFSFLIAIILIKLAGRPTLIQRFALSESRRAEKYLAQDLTDTRDRSRADMARRIILEIFGLEVVKREYHYLIPVADYLRHSAVFHEREWKLVNRQVEDGLVVLRPDKAVRLVRHALTIYIASKIRDSPAPPPDTIRGLEGEVARLVSEADRLTPAYEITGKNPPCIEHAVESLSRGENLPHSARFMLGTFLLSRGKSVEEIAPLFKSAPDYSERITMYQLNHLAGKIGPTRYSCPSCSKLRVQGLCFATRECDGIINPVQFGRRMIKAPAPEEGTEEGG